MPGYAQGARRATFSAKIAHNRSNRQEALAKEAVRIESCDLTALITILYQLPLEIDEGNLSCTLHYFLYLEQTHSGGLIGKFTLCPTSCAPEEVIASD
jgi:hypothetical protein